MIKAETVAGLKKLSGQFKALAELADDLEGVGSIENAAAEAKKSLADTQAQIAEAQTHLQFIKAEIGSLSSPDAPHKVKAAALIANAEEKAAFLLESAGSRVGIELQKAENDAVVIRAKAQKEVDSIRAEVNILDSHRSAIRAEVSELSAQASALRAELEKLKSKFM
jgi:DNA repair exonuclease SbcCD ATPase subunit